MIRPTAVSLVSMVALFCVSLAAQAKDYFHIYLTWMGETSQTMTINFNSNFKNKAFKKSFVRYDVVSRKDDPEAYQFQQQGDSTKGLFRSRRWHRVQLDGLEPNRTYYFVVGDRHGGWSEEKIFRTLPGGQEPIRFVSGGDVGTGPEVPPLLREAAATDPMFALIGGDIAYANGRLSNLYRWDAWLENWTENMVGPNGNLIPIVAAIGNHEVFPFPPCAPFFFKVFAQGTSSYFRRTFGDNLVLYTLDTGHMVGHDFQVNWLKENMKRDDGKFSFKVALYHRPLYPGHRSYQNSASRNGRRHWLPIFDQFHLDIAFENHDHVQKRTKRLKGDRVVDAGGTIYLGDGAMGKTPRKANDRWYLEKSHSIQHFWLAEVDSEQARFRAISEKGIVFDELEIQARQNPN